MKKCMNAIKVNKLLSNQFIKNTKKDFKLSMTLKYSSFITNFVKRNFSTVYVNHRDTFTNNELAPFDFTEENYKKVEEILVSAFFIDRRNIQIKKNQL